MFKKIWNKIFPERKSLQQLWDERSYKVIRTTIEFDSGLIRELTGKQSDDWHKAQWMARYGVKPDFSQFKWKESRPQDNKKD